VFQKC